MHYLVFKRIFIRTSFKECDWHCTPVYEDNANKHRVALCQEYAGKPVASYIYTTPANRMLYRHQFKKTHLLIK